MAEALAHRLRRLQAMRDCGQKLFARPILGRTTFDRGQPEQIQAIERPLYSLGLYDLLRAYADHLARNSVTVLTVEAADLWSVEDALARLESMLGLGQIPDWSVLSAFLPPSGGDPLKAKSAIAATFVAALELTRQGRLVLRQDGGRHAPIHVRASRPGDRVEEEEGGNDS
jgi:segregation and condensation protein A